MNSKNHMSRDEVLYIIETAQKDGKTPILEGADLQNTDLNNIDLHGSLLWGANLSGANLRNANLAGANLHATDLQGAHLSGANLSNAVLNDANLEQANLYDADLHNASLPFANLRYSQLYKTNLQGANLENTDFHNAKWYGFCINGLVDDHNHHITLAPTPDGWVLHISGWQGTFKELHELIAHNSMWSDDIAGDSLVQCYPYLESILTLCELYAKNNAHCIKQLKKMWG